MKKSGITQYLIRRHGAPVKILTGDGTENREAHAFIQPLRYKNKRYFDGDFLQGGLADSRHYLYIGEAAVRIDLIGGPVRIRRGTEDYTVRRSEAVFLGRDCVYVWAILQPYVPEA